MSVEDNALTLAEFDRAVRDALLEKDFEKLGRALDAYKELKRSLRVRLLDEPAISAAVPAAADVLRKITRGEGLTSASSTKRRSNSSDRTFSLRGSAIMSIYAGWQSFVRSSSA